MARGVGGIIAGVVTLVVGGTIYSVSNQDIVNNFSKETGMSQEAAKQYVESIPEDELASFTEVGQDLVSDGREIFGTANGIDCVNYTYEWESASLSCPQGKSQLQTFAQSEIDLGNAYVLLSADSADASDMAAVIREIDALNANYDLAIIQKLMEPFEIEDAKQTNLYNKSLIKAALESD